MNCSKSRRVDRRKRRHRNETRQQGFKLQMEAFADSYATYIYNRDHGTTPEPSHSERDAMYIYRIHAQDTCSKFLTSIHEPSHVLTSYAGTTETHIVYPSTALSPCAAIVAQGIIPTAPQTPTLGFRVETLELYRTAHFRCPQLSVQAWVRTMADLQGVSP